MSFFLCPFILSFSDFVKGMSFCALLNKKFQSANNLSFGFICLKFNDIVSKLQQIAPKTILN